ncbi:histidine kinase [Actinosynnema sp. NPDC050436]|uniref:histidine kinase n=1 Tax=Actinosynnema sp. NPDC050436 TaxID=3155659 RepID=UPI0034049742
MRGVLLWSMAAVPVVWAAITSLPGRFTPWEAVAYLVVLAGAVPSARRWPVGALAVTGVVWLVSFLTTVMDDSTVAVGALSAGLGAVAFLAGREASDGDRGVVALVLLGAAAVTGSPAVGGGADTALAALCGVAALAAVPWTVGRYRRQYLALVRAGWERAEQLERDADRAADRARARERARLAAEMHDLVGHELARAALRVGALELAPDLDAGHRESARAAREAVTAAAERLADVVGLLRAGEPERTEPVADVVARARLAGLDVESTGDDLGAVDPVIARTVHRVVTEAITNAIKHAPGARVTVALAHTDRVRVDVVSGTARHTSALAGAPTGTECAGSGRAGTVSADSGRAGTECADSGRAGTVSAGSRRAGTESAGGGQAGDMPAGDGRDGTEPVGCRRAGAAQALEPADAAGGPDSSGIAPGGGHGLLGLAERVALVGGTFSARALDGGFEVRASLPAHPVLRRSPATDTHRRRAELRVRRSARRTALLTTAVAVGIVAAVLGYLVFDAATSVLDPADFQRLRAGQSESEVSAVLPARTRVDDPGRTPPPPAGTSCRHYSTHRNPFDARRLDLYRLCFRDGRLVAKDLLARDP